MIKKNYLLTIFSFLISLLIAEIVFQLIYSGEKNFRYSSAEERFILYDSPDGHVFDVYKNFFKYKPNKKILTETYFKKDKNFIKEFSYIIQTNNYGLVQKKIFQKKIVKLGSLI